MIQRSLNELKNEDKAPECPECGSHSIVFENEELYCKKCGFVIE
jgi:ribosomal protein S27AE